MVKRVERTDEPDLVNSSLLRPLDQTCDVLDFCIIFVNQIGDHYLKPFVLGTGGSKEFDIFQDFLVRPGVFFWIMRKIIRLCTGGIEADADNIAFFKILNSRNDPLAIVEVRIKPQTGSTGLDRFDHLIHPRIEQRLGGVARQSKLFNIAFTETPDKTE